MRKKREEDKVLHKEEQYQFIKEQVRPQQRKQAIKSAKRVGGIVLGAVLFGVISGGIIAFTQNHFVEPKENVVKINTYTAIPEETPEAGKEGQGTNADKEFSLAKANKLTRQLAAVGNKVSSSLVGIRKKSSVREWLMDEKSGRSVEYGVLVQETDKEFYILTTNNVIQEQATATVQLMDNTTIEGTVMGSDTQLNMAVVRIKKSDIAKNLLLQMNVAQLGNGISLTNGTNVIAAGCPNGVLKSVIVGRVTNDSLEASITDGEVPLYCTDIPYSAEANGIVLDIGGRVVGIISNDFTEEAGTAGLSFIKISNVMEVIDLLKQRQNAPYLGIEGSSLELTLAKAHKLEAGAYVTEIYFGSPAYVGGMRVADVIIQIDGKNISTMSDVYQSLLKHRPGDTLTYTISRKSGKEKLKKQLKIRLE